MSQNPRESELRYTQNFLHSPALVDRLVSEAGIHAGDTVLEIGPGKGIITRRLAEAVGTGGRVMAVELDRTLAERLAPLMRDTPQVSIVHGDALQFDTSTLPADYSVFSNVPFNITSALLETLFTPPHGPKQAHLILQDETLIAFEHDGAVGETFKSLMLAPFYDIYDVHRFRRTDFTPSPAVDTSLFLFERRPTPRIAASAYPLYKDFLAAISKDRAGEGIWRKLFSATQIARLADQSGLIAGRGLKAQTANAITATFHTFAQSPRREAVTGAMAALRAEQQRREHLNRTGHHRRNNR